MERYLARDDGRTKGPVLCGEVEGEWSALMCDNFDDLSSGPVGSWSLSIPGQVATFYPHKNNRRV